MGLDVSTCVCKQRELPAQRFEGESFILHKSSGDFVTLHPWWYLLSRICLTLVFRTPYILLLPEWSGCPRFPSVCLFLLTFFLNSPEASSSDFADEAWGLSVLGFLKTSLSLHSWVGLSGGALGGQRPPLGPESPCRLLSFLCFLPSFW